MVTNIFALYADTYGLFSYNSSHYDKSGALSSMYIDISTITKNGRTYRRVLLRESYRENGKVKKRTIANLSACSEKEIAAIKLGAVLN